MRSFIFASGLLLLLSCKASYRVADTTLASPQQEMPALQPVFTKALYQAGIDGRFLIKRFHLSGLLFFKRSEDGAVRVIFQNQMGIIYFDFSWTASGTFSVHSIIEQMNKQSLIAVLRKDFEMLLANTLPAAEPRWLKDAENGVRLRYWWRDAFLDYRCDSSGNLTGVENHTNRRMVTAMRFLPPSRPGSLPAMIVIDHPRAHFNITLKKLDIDASE